MPSDTYTNYGLKDLKFVREVVTAAANEAIADYQIIQDISNKYIRGRKGPIGAGGTLLGLANDNFAVSEVLSEALEELQDLRKTYMRHLEKIEDLIDTQMDAYR